uniref:Uncharacterized protein n=1 Tax=Timema genevievae TaxID=629358 RepID=A0A7R9JTL2_TIMGE|nr:unnamed protein product [Timema genevievae]
MEPSLASSITYSNQQALEAYISFCLQKSHSSARVVLKLGVKMAGDYRGPHQPSRDGGDFVEGPVPHYPPPYPGDDHQHQSSP